MKKKITLNLALALFLISVTHAQIEKNDWLLGGSLGIDQINSSSGPGYTINSTSNASIAPYLGYALAKNSVAGLNLELNHYNDGNSISSTYTTNVFFEKFFRIKEKFGAFLQINAGIIWVKNSHLVADSTSQATRTFSTSKVYDAGLIPGLYYQAAKKILLTANCGGLLYDYFDFGGGYTATNWSINLLNNFTFGIGFILGKK